MTPSPPIYLERGMSFSILDPRVESWFVLVQARRRWIGGPKWSRQSIANRLVEISVRSNFFLGFGRDRNQYLELQNLTE